jgi:branched-chain amino acid transport system ATP-binding protein
MSAVVLSVEGLSKAYAGHVVVSGLSFTISAGEMVAMIGPNGAGKTTTFNMINGQLRPDTGRIRLCGEDVTGESPSTLWRRGMARTFQITATLPTMTVAENVAVALMMRDGSWASARRLPDALIDEARQRLTAVGLSRAAERLCGTLAYGDLKRVELVVALVNAPRLLLMDEPTAGMAPRERDQLMQLAAAMARQSRTAVLFTEHDMDVVFGHARRILVLHRGERIAEGPPAAIRSDARVREVYLGGGSTSGIR